MSITHTTEVGLASRPSPRLWKDCKGALLNDLGLGFFVHEEFLGVGQTRVLTGPVIVLPDPTDTPANADALRDDLTAVWIPAVIAAFATAGYVVTYTALTDPGVHAALIAELNVNLQEMSDDFAANGQQFGADLTAIPPTAADADAVRDFIVATTNPELEAAFLDLYANQGYSVPSLEIDFDPDAIIGAETGKFGGWLSVTNDADDNDAFALVLRPFVKIDLDSGNKAWFEARFFLDATGDQGFFVGLAEEAALNRDVVADDCAALIGESLVGFQSVASDVNVDAVFQLDGTAVEILADANQSTAITNSGVTVADFTDDAEHKLGMRFDGRHGLDVFVDGVRVIRHDLRRANFPDDVDLGFVIALKNGTAAAREMVIDWVRVAYQGLT
jgi:hypothetical protein